MKSFDFLSLCDRSISVSAPGWAMSGSSVVSVPSEKAANIPCSIQRDGGSSFTVEGRGNIMQTHSIYIPTEQAINTGDLIIDDNAVTYEILDHHWVESAIGSYYYISARLVK